MGKKAKDDKITRSNKLLRWVFAITAIAIISFFFPKEDNTGYNYTLGQPWTYTLLTAPFDIPINLDQNSKAAIQDSINKAFVPIYKRDVNTQDESIQDLNNELAETSISEYNRNRVIEQAQQIYDDGIVDNNTFNLISKDSLPQVRFVVNNDVIPTSTASFKSVRGAYIALDSACNDFQTRQILAKIVVSRYLNPNIVYDSIESNRLLAQLYQKALAPVGMIQKGERIVDRGDIVTPQTYEVLKTYEELSAERIASRQDFKYNIVGQVVMIAMLITALFLFLIFFRRSILQSTKKTAFIVYFLTIFTVAAFAVISRFGSGVYIMPFAIAPVILTTFFDSRTALHSHIIVVLICALTVAYPLEFIIMQVLAGVTAIVSVQELARRSQLVKCALYVFLVYSLTYAAMQVVAHGTISNISRFVIGYFAINVVLFSFTYVLIFIIEKIFGFTSTVTLVELADVNNPLLRELSEKCPGTFQHSLQVSNLAAEAAHAIGANSVLVRAGAMYHDIGKLDNPAFFTENQLGENPHKMLAPEVSAQIVIEHVQNGLRRAVKAKLPTIITDFITQHHGKGKAKYFYTQVCNTNPDIEIDPEPFTYPGPNPQTKETAILMMADSTEAASRSLKDHTDRSIRTLVEKIIDSQIADGLMKEAPLSFRDVETIKDIFTQRLCIIYHTRIAYPDAIKKNQ